MGQRIVPRASVRRMAEAMEEKLRINDDVQRIEWRDQPPEVLMIGLLREVSELREAVERGRANEIVYEAADVANYAMFIADVFSGVKERRGKDTLDLL